MDNKRKLCFMPISSSSVTVYFWRKLHKHLVTWYEDASRKYYWWVCATGTKNLLLQKCQILISQGSRYLERQWSVIMGYCEWFMCSILTISEILHLCFIPLLVSCCEIKTISPFQPRKLSDHGYKRSSSVGHSSARMNKVNAKIYW